MRRAAAVAGWIALAALGAWLRVRGLGDQVVADDEMHSLAALAQVDAAYLLTHFFPADVSAPQAVLQRWIGLAWGLDEWSVRLPTLAAGLAALVVWPLLLRHEIGARAAAIFAALVAMSPQLVYHSRYARPYMASTFFAFTAALLLVRLHRRAAWTRAVACAASAASAVWFSLLAAPAVAAPVASLWLRGRVEGERERERERENFSPPRSSRAASRSR